MKNELACSPFLVESRHLIRDPFHVPLAKPFARRQAVKSSTAAIGATAIATTAADQIAGWHARDPMNRAAPVGKRQRVQVLQHGTRFGETHSLSVPICDAGDFGQ